MTLDHINIAAPMELLTLVRDFYRDALGLEEGLRPDFPFRGFWMYGEGKPIIHLMESNAHYPAPKPHYLDHVAFRMTDVNAYTKRLQSLSIDYKTKYIADFKISQVFCHDPCGNGVEVNFVNEVFEP